jgi:putative ABC transport system permease protein
LLALRARRNEEHLFRTFLLLSSRYLRRRRLRTLLVVASIALGVATLVATRALNASLARAAQGAVTPFSAATDLLVLNGQVGVPMAAVTAIRQAGLPEVREVQPVVIGRVGLPDLDNRSVLLLGIDETIAARAGLRQRPVPADPNNPWGVTVAWRDDAGDLWRVLLTGQKPALVGRGLADELAATSAGKELQARAGAVERRLRLLGTVTLHGPAAPLGQNVLFLRLTDAAEFVFPTRPDHVSQVNITLQPGSDREAVRKRLQEIVGERAEVRTAAANAQAVRDVTAGLELGFAIGGMGALIVGLFLVYNALSVSVAERRHDIGVLRSVGATRMQVAGLFVAEAGVLGLIGALLGVPLGLALARLGVGPLGRLLSDLFVNMDAGVEASAHTMVLAVASGVLVSLLAALAPALQAAFEQPADAVRRVPLSASLVLRMSTWRRSWRWPSPGWPACSGGTRCRCGAAPSAASCSFCWPRSRPRPC